MSAGKVAGRAAQTRASAAGGVANDLTALRFTWRSMIQPAPIGQASACKPHQRPPVVRWLVATAALARTVRWPFPEVAARIPQHYLETAPSGRSTDPRTPRNLFNPAEGLSMEKPARASFRASSKFVPLGQICRASKTASGTSRKPLIQRMYTLCEVSDGERQFVPPREPAFCRRKNRPVSGSSADRLFGRSGSGRRILSGSYVIPGLEAMGCQLSPHASTPLPGTNHPENPHPDVGQKTVFFGGAK